VPGVAATDADRTQRWLHATERRLRDARPWLPEDDFDRELEVVLAGVEALVAARALDDRDAERWHGRLRAAGRGSETRPDSGPEVRHAAAELLEELLAAVPEGEEPPPEPLQRLEGALVVLSAAGAVDAGTWDARFRARAGWPTLEEERAQDAAREEEGRLADVVGVHPGPVDGTGGWRVVLVVLYADGLEVELECDAEIDRGDDWPDWELSDDAGTEYFGRGASGAGHSEELSFLPAPPPGVRRLELRRGSVPEVRLGVELG
jgi:hypothetical protein